MDARRLPWTVGSNAGAALVDGITCDLREAVDRAFAHLPLRAAIIIRGALPCTEHGYGGVWRDLIKLRRPTLDVAVAAADGGLAVLAEKGAAIIINVAGVAAWPAAFDFEFLMRTASSSMAGRRSARLMAGGLSMRTPLWPGPLMFTVT